MRTKLVRLFAALAVTAGLAGGGAALASASSGTTKTATTAPSTTTTTTTTPPTGSSTTPAPGHPPGPMGSGSGTHHCPGM